MARPFPLRPPAALAFMAALSACGLTTGEFPSLLPRPEEIPRDIALLDTAPASLSQEETVQLQADLQRDRAAFADIRNAIEVADRALAAALARARGSGWGSLPWTEAQVALSQYQEERFPLSVLRLRLDASRLMVDPLAEADPSRIAVETLAAEVMSLEERSATRAEAAMRALER
ncbi:MAG: hypothetical protein ACK4TG_00960 [Thermaurantiacus sp.]